MSNDDNEVTGRRPLKVRQVHLARNFAAWLSSKRITPNQISILSVLFALLAAYFILELRPERNFLEFLRLGDGPNANRWWIAILAALFIQCRLLCNLFDGMVAVEGGKTTASGELFNDIPDRIADPLILIAAGYACNSQWGIELGWCAGLLAVMTAYVRNLGVGMGAPSDFRGPMAKQHRMAVVTFALVLSAFEKLFLDAGSTLTVALLVIIAGSALTAALRSVRIYQFLEGGGIPK